MNALAKLGEMPLSRVIILSIVITGLYYLVGFDDGQKFRTSIAAYQGNLAEATSEITKLNKEIEEINLLKSEQDRDSERLNTLLAYIPEKLTKTELMRTLGNEAKTVGVSINSIRDPAGSAKRSEFYEEIGIDVELTGSFAQLVLFLANLTKLNQILTVDSLDLKSFASDVDSLSMSAKVRGYRYVSVQPTTGVKK